MTKHGQSAAVGIHVSDPARGRRTEVLGHKIQQIIAGRDGHNIDILAIQEHRLTSTEPINYLRLGDWKLAHTSSPVECHGIAHLYNKSIAPLVIAIDHMIIISYINTFIIAIFQFESGHTSF